MTILVAHPLGHVGFVSFVKALHRLGVLDHDELLGWRRLPGQIIRLLETPLDDGSV
jgi:hypothetical protein